MDPATTELIAGLLSAGGPTGLIALFVLFMFAKSWITKAWSNLETRLDKAEEGLVTLQEGLQENSKTLKTTAETLKKAGEAIETVGTTLGHVEQALGRVEVTLTRMHAGPPVNRPSGAARPNGAPFSVVEDHTPIL